MLTTIILAGGQGKRMQSDLPKVLNKLKGRALVDWVVDLAKKINSDQIIVVVGYKKELVVTHLGAGFDYVVQAEQKGTGHAVSVVEHAVKDGHETVLVLNGDVPLLDIDDLNNLLLQHKSNLAAATILTSEAPPDAKGYGRIVRSVGDKVKKIVEERDATADELKITEVNTGTFCFDRKKLFEALKNINCDNDQHEYYITDVIEALAKKGYTVTACKVSDWHSIIGTNTFEELQLAEMILEKRSAITDKR